MPLPCMCQYELKQVISTLWHHIFLPMEWELDGTTSKAWKALQLMGKAKQKKKKQKKERKKGKEIKKEKSLWICVWLPIPFTLLTTHIPFFAPSPGE